jgi:hypothetical protein
MPQKAQSGNLSVLGVFLAEIWGCLSLLPFNLTPRFKVKCDLEVIGTEVGGLTKQWDFYPLTWSGNELKPVGNQT